MTIRTIADPEFLSLKSEIEGNPRLCGYYLIDLVSIRDLRERGLKEEEVRERVFQHFDDQEWPPAAQRPTDQTWADYEAEPSTARNVAIESLIGGPQIGHTQDTIPIARATALWKRFEGLFTPAFAYYVGMGFGDPAYVFQQGAAVISENRAGLIWVVESD